MNNIEITRLKKDDLNQLIEFLNNVFTVQNGKEMHFENSYPRIFRLDDKMMNCHLAAKDSGKICGVVATYPFKYHVGDSVLKVGSTGNVAVDSNYRGQGLMQKLMTETCRQNKEAGLDMCFLHGDRWRYRHFGFERCGVELNFHIKASMMRDYEMKNSVKLIMMTEENDSLNKKLYEFYKTQHTYEEREFETFYYAMTAKGHITYVITSENEEKVKGYITVSGEQTSIIELALDDVRDFPEVIKTHMNEHNVEIVYFSVPAYHPAIPDAITYADRYTAFQPGNFLIFNFKNVAEAFMKEKNKYETMPDGTITIDSDIFGKWKIEKAGNDIKVDAFIGEADFVLEGYSAYQFVFGTLPPMGKRESGEKEALAKLWFPLPLYGPYLS